MDGRCAFEVFVPVSARLDAAAYEGVNTIELPSDLKRLEAQALVGTAAEVIIIPKGCEYIEASAFDGCPSLVYIVYRSDLTISAPDSMELIRK